MVDPPESMNTEGQPKDNEYNIESVDSQQDVDEEQ